MADGLKSWPQSLRAIAEVIGPAEAVRLAEKVGGVMDVYIPRRPTRTHLYLQAIRNDSFDALCQAFGGQHLTIARGVYRHLKKDAIATTPGSTRQVAIAVGASQRYVKKVRAELGKPDTGKERPGALGDLFDES